MNAYLKDYLQCKLRLFEFVQHIDRALMHMHNEEAHNNLNSIHSNLVITMHIATLERHTVDYYTREVFLFLCDEMLFEINFRVV